MSLTVDAAIAEGHEALQAVADDPRREAEMFLRDASGRSQSQLIAWPQRRLALPVVKRYRTVLRRRVAGEPVAYILGHREFWSLNLRVTPETLIPRHETELLVELALQRIPVARRVRVLDLGTGSGAIALALAHERPSAAITATDISPDALEVARGNAEALGLDRVAFLLGDWFAPLDEEVRFRIIAGNPPYVAAGDPHLDRGDLPWEPRSALVGGDDGLLAIRRIVVDAPSWLEPDGWLLLEHGPNQGAAVCELLRDRGMGQIICHQDLLGLDRVTAARWPG